MKLLFCLSFASVALLSGCQTTDESQDFNQKVLKQEQVREEDAPMAPQNRS